MHLDQHKNPALLHPPLHCRQPHPTPTTTLQTTSPYTHHYTADNLTLHPPLHCRQPHPTPTTTLQTTSPYTHHYTADNLTLHYTADNLTLHYTADNLTLHYTADNLTLHPPLHCRQPHPTPVPTTTLQTTTPYIADNLTSLCLM